MIDCPKAGDRDLAPLYLAGKLREEEARAFEEHFFACESCRRDVEKGSELRALYGKSPLGLAKSSARPSRFWWPAAVAAAIALVAVGVWQANRRSLEALSVPRGAEAGIEGLAISPLADGGLDVAWTPRPEAALYHVQVFGPDGRSLWKTETREPRVRIENSLLLPQPLRRTCDVRVEAVDSMGQVLAGGEAAIGSPP